MFSTLDIPVFLVLFCFINPWSPIHYNQMHLICNRNLPSLATFSPLTGSSLIIAKQVWNNTEHFLTLKSNCLFPLLQPVVMHAIMSALYVPFPVFSIYKSNAQKNIYFKLFDFMIVSSSFPWFSTYIAAALISVKLISYSVIGRLVHTEPDCILQKNTRATDWTTSGSYLT